MEAPRYCPSCGGALVQGSNFCGRCGHHLVAKRKGGGAGWKIAFVLTALVAAGALVWIFVFDEDPPPAVACPGGTCPAFDPGRGAQLNVQGTGSFLDKVKILVPAGALKDKLALQIAPAPPDSVPPRMADPETEVDPTPVGPVIRFGPDGQRFAKPITVTLPYDPTKIPEGRLAAVLLYGNNRGERIEPIRVDAKLGVVEVAITHFSDALVILDPGRDVVLTSVGPSNPETFGPSAWGPSRPPDKPDEPLPCDDAFRPIATPVLTGDYRLHNNTDLFWGGVGLPPGERTMLWFLYAEDGGAMSSIIDGHDIPIKPIRTGGETAMLRQIKEHIRKGGLPLTSEMLLDMAARAVKDHDGGSNLAAAAVCALNVTKVIARADKWFDEMLDKDGKPCPPDKPNCGYSDAIAKTYGHPADDPMSPVFRDLIGAESVDGGPTFYEMMGGRMQGTRDFMAIQNKPFEPRGGVFAHLEGAEGSIMNAGAHYYYFTGVVGQLFEGRFKTSAGVWVEQIVTKIKEDTKAGLVQGDHVLRGRDLMACVSETLPARDLPPEPPPCPPLVETAQKCPWSPEGFAVYPCPPGKCFDSGPQGFLACKQIETPAGAGRNENNNVVCGPGMVPRSERCNPGVVTGCDPASVGP